MPRILFVRAGIRRYRTVAHPAPATRVRLTPPTASVDGKPGQIDGGELRMSFRTTLTALGGIGVLATFAVGYVASRLMHHRNEKP